MRKRCALAWVVGIACMTATTLAAGAGVALAAYPTADDFTDWTSVAGSPAVATGTLNGSPISISGTHVFPPPVSVVDAHWTFNAGPDFAPPLAHTDIIQIGANPLTESYTVTFGTPVTDPVIEIGSLGSRLEFPSGTRITKIVGQSGFTVSGSTITGAGNPTLGPDGINDSNGTVQLTGTFASISFTATETGAVEDGVLLQIGAAPPPPPPPTTTPTTTTTPSGGAGGTAPPPPAITALHVFGTVGGASRALLTAGFAGEARQLQWFIAGSNRPVLTTSAALSTLRFRPSATGSVVGVRAIGPGGVSPIVHATIPPLPLPGGAVAKKIGAAVSAGHPVLFAAANPAFDLKGGINAALCAHFASSRISAEDGLLDIKGCASPLTSLSQLPPSLEGIVADMAKQDDIPLNHADANLGLSLSDAYKAIGPVVVNGMTLESGPDGVVIFPQIHLIAAANATLSIGAIKLANPVSGPVKIDTTPRFGRIPLGTFHSIPGADLVPGFNLVGDVSVTAVPPSGGAPAGVAIAAHLRLPSWLSIGGVAADATVDLRATTDAGLILDAMQTRVQNLYIGPLQVSNFQIRYTRAAGNGLAGDRWEGQATVCVPTGAACIDMAPPNGGVRIVDGQLDFIGAAVPFSPPVTLFPGLDLTRIGFGFGLNPTRFLVTTAQLLAAHVLTIDGRMIIAFPSGTPYTLEHDASFLDPPPAPRPFPTEQYSIPHTGFTLAASARVSLTVPVLGDLPLGGGYFVYEAPGYISAGGGIEGQSLLGFGEVSGGVSGEINFANGRFNIHGDVDFCTGIDCPNGIFTVHQAGDVNFSDIGMSICVRPGLFPDFGLGIYWPGRFPGDWHPQGPGCRWSTYADKNVHGSADRTRGRQAAATLPYTFTVRRGDPGLSIRLAGAAAGAPRVRVVTPSGQTLDSPASDGVVGSEQLMIIRYNGTRITSVGMRHGVAGTYRIEPLPGSPPVGQIATATPLPDAKITAAVEGSGTSRTLVYDIAPRLGQRVQFLELTASAAARPIATVGRAGRGQLRFTTAPGVGARSIVAQFELNRLPAERITVAHFQPPSPRLGRIAALHVARRGTTVHARWTTVPGASAYELVLTTGMTRQRRLRVRGTTLTLRSVPVATAGRITVRAVDTLRDGPVASAAFRATASPRTRLGRLPKAPRLR